MKTTMVKLMKMVDLDIQDWLVQVGTRNASALAKALVGANEAVRDHVFRNLSEHACACLKKDVDNIERKGVSELEILESAAVMERLM